jgi:hypothetical protein
MIHTSIAERALKASPLWRSLTVNGLRTGSRKNAANITGQFRMPRSNVGMEVR